jgi:hypothetical protein
VLKLSQGLAIGIHGVEHGDETLHIVMFCADICGEQTYCPHVGCDVLQLVTIIGEMSSVLSKQVFQVFIRGGKPYESKYQAEYLSRNVLAIQWAPGFL